MTDCPIATAHGFRYSHQCACSTPGSIYAKGKVILTIHSKQPTFLLKRPGNANSSGRIEDLETVLNNYGI